MSSAPSPDRGQSQPQRRRARAPLGDDSGHNAADARHDSDENEEDRHIVGAETDLLLQSRHLGDDGGKNQPLQKESARGTEPLTPQNRPYGGRLRQRTGRKSPRREAGTTARR